MGIFKDKYSDSYFTGEDKNGNKLNYGATSCKDENGHYILRPHDEKILNKINFVGKRVLEFGFGRGEIAKYAIDKKAIYYEGVDFSEVALNIAITVTKDCFPKPIFYNRDALEYILDISDQLTSENKFDIVMMFDFIEHVPRNELYQIFKHLHKIISDKGIIVLNTPAYKYDNDVIQNGLDNRNNENSFDTSDLIEETAGMHCNKYSIISLQTFMQECGFINVSEAHFYIRRKQDDFANYLFEAYSFLWSQCANEGYPVHFKYSDDEVEYSYRRYIQPVWSKMDKGLMKGIELLCTEDYKNNVYGDGEYDSEILLDFRENYSAANVVFDVGGFVGINSLLFAKNLSDAGKVITFEPNPWNLNRIRLNLSHNKEVSENISIMRIALGEKEHIEQMLMSEEIDQGYSSTSRLENSHSKIADDKLPAGFFNEDVRVRTLDNVIKDIGLVPDVIKVDIEGSEHLFLLGAQETLNIYKPVLYIELHSEFCATMCIMLLLKHGYVFEVLREESDNRLMIKAYPGDTEIKFGTSEQTLSNLIASVSVQKSALRLMDKCNLFIDRFNIISYENDILGKNNEELSKHNEELSKQNEELSKQKAESIKQNEELNKQNDKLSDMLTESNVALDIYITDLSEQKAQLISEIESLQTIENSTLWRMTKPVRVMLDLIKSLFK
jgi:FkbM family methyltransferase